MPDKVRVFMTGIGVVSPIGTGKEQFWTSLLEAKDGIALYEPLQTRNVGAQKASLVKDFDSARWLQGYNYRRLSRYGKFTTASIELAIQDSGLDLTNIEATRKGLIFSTVHGAFEDSVAYIQKLLDLGPSGVSPLKFAQTVDNAPATLVSIKYQLKGVSTVVEGVSACAVAYDYLTNQQADIIICGGVDVIASVEQIIALEQAGVLAHTQDGLEETSRPGDIRRNGMIYGEAAAFVVLETEQSVQQRQADVYCEIAGYGAAHDNEAITLLNQRNTEPIIAAMQNALNDAGIAAQQIEYLNSLANSTPGIDEVEARAIQHVFDGAARLPVSTCKGATGETFGASDALGLIQAALSLKHQTIAPIANLTEIDPACGLQYVTQPPQPHVMEYALANSFEVGGNVQSMVLKNYKDFS
ncbi:MAG: beta-ketoacyl-[acyl-carrier-protein] synthase family protein [Candidatus Vecturithrix sp.]|jgi:3-oxoacyl-[acyl-carrier-protein] synthase II|nr:beta-ketoacyl-[acyl-carrier-protein] synthase family protein [Candidatus Vecturithrix sp.]